MAEQMYDNTEDILMRQKLARLGNANIPVAGSPAELSMLQNVQVKDDNGKLVEINAAEAMKKQMAASQQRQPQVRPQNIPQNFQPNIQQLPPKSEFKYFKAGNMEFRMNLYTNEIESNVFELSDTLPDCILVYDDGTEITFEEYIKSQNITVKVKAWRKCDETP